ncbi:hypothetical protein [Halocynthiibacter sp.]|uniref:hypothetical protein n=1 Tax=Halocynthiibacter sp. TaxID=1979210 RepID=UPI003C460A6A
MKMEINIKPVPVEVVQKTAGKRRVHIMPRAVREFLKSPVLTPKKTSKPRRARDYGAARYLDDLGSPFPGDPPQIRTPENTQND